MTGAIIGEVRTDSLSRFTAGGWSGDGTIGANAGHLSSGMTVMVDDTTGGLLSLGRTANTANGIPYGGGFGNGVSPSFTDITATMRVVLGGGGTADISSLATSDGFATNFLVSDFSQEVNSLRVMYQFSEPIAANRPGIYNFGSFLGAFRRPEGSGNLAVTSTYTGLVHSTDGMTFVPGIPTTAEAVEMNNTVFSRPDGASSAAFSYDPDSSSGLFFQGLHGYDLDGAGLEQATIGGPIEDMELVYATGITFDIVPEQGSFSADSVFRFSLNGAQWPQTIDAAMKVPEPSGVLLGLVGLAWVIIGRRR